MFTGHCDSKTGERVARLRRQRKPNRRDFVRHIPGMTYQELAEIENGERQPHLEELLLLAHFLETKSEFLAFGRDPGNRKLGIRERQYVRHFLGDPWHRIRHQLARYHNGQ